MTSKTLMSIPQYYSFITGQRDASEGLLTQRPESDSWYHSGYRFRLKSIITGNEFLAADTWFAE